ncbi:hypothetical protein ACUVJH_21130 [Aeromonas veronii]|uniref:hypothetical protein n=1 Tax=Aeromonas veronii TaxID=654 RepID=UPI0040558CE3
MTSKGGTSRPFPFCNAASPITPFGGVVPLFSGHLFLPSQSAVIKLASRITRFHKRIAAKFITLPAILSTQGVLLLYGNIDPAGIDFA